MKTFLISIAVLLGISAFLILMLSFYSGKSIKRIFVNAVLGLSILAVIDFTSRYTGVHIPINLFSVLGIGVFSIPAVIGLLLLNIIMI